MTLKNLLEILHKIDDKFPEVEVYVTIDEDDMSVMCKDDIALSSDLVPGYSNISASEAGYWVNTLIFGFQTALDKEPGDRDIDTLEFIDIAKGEH